MNKTKQQKQYGRNQNALFKALIRETKDFIEVEKQKILNSKIQQQYYDSEAYFYPVPVF